MRIIAVDTETTVKNGERASPYQDDLLLITVNDGETISVSTNLSDFEDLLGNPTILKVFQNAAFDIQFLEYSSFLTIENVWDTMLVERLLTAGTFVDCSLGGIVLRYCDVVLDKGVRDSFWRHRGELSDFQIEYAKNDVRYLIEVYKKQKEAIDARGMTHIAQLENDLAPIIARMELSGVGFDPEAWEDIIEEEKKIIPELDRDLQMTLSKTFKMGLFGEILGAVNLNSPSQLSAAMRRIGVKVEDTSEGELRSCLHPVAGKILEYRSHVGRLKWDYPKFVNSKTKRIHPDYNQLGAATGRFSCSDPNLQQVPKDPKFRRMFRALPGYKLITLDYSQQELRVMAELSQDPGLIEACKSTDVHLENARMIYDDPTIQKNDPRRSTAKNANFAMAYRAGVKVFAATAGITVKESSRFLKVLHKAYPGVFTWGDRMHRFLLDNGYVSTIGGRRRYFQGVNSKGLNYLSIASNSPVQGSSADMLKLAMVYIHDALKQYDAKLVLCVHDEVIVEAEEKNVEEIAEVVKAAMVRAGEYYVKVVPVPVDGLIGDTWSK